MRDAACARCRELKATHDESPCRSRFPGRGLAVGACYVASRRRAERTCRDPDCVRRLGGRAPDRYPKFGEEAVEAVVAALAQDREELVGEAADVLFHLLVMLAEKNVTLTEVMAELDRREGVSGLEEKANRSR